MWPKDGEGGRGRDRQRERLGDKETEAERACMHTCVCMRMCRKIERERVGEREGGWVGEGQKDRGRNWSVNCACVRTCTYMGMY